jgi:ribosomal protein S14
MVAEIRQLLASYGRNPQEFLDGCRQDTICDGKPSTIKRIEATPFVPPVAPLPPQVIERHAERCERCDTIDPFRLSGGFRRVGERAGVASARCWRCGHKAKIVKSF